MTPNMLSGLHEIADNYDAIFCDIWGVLHNGTTPFAGVPEALRQLKTSGKPVILLSNAPRPSSAAQQRLRNLGVPDDCYDEIVTSGNAAIDILSERTKRGETYYFVGADKDMDTIEGFEDHQAELETADFILLTGMHDDLSETPEDYHAPMQDWLNHNLTVICANPDRIVQMGDRILFCAGAIAEIYEGMGGNVVWLGKPYPYVYDLARKRVFERLNLPKDTQISILAIGDGPKTDIVGANQETLDVIYITGGLGSSETDFDLTDPEKIKQRLAQDGGYAFAAMKHLVW